MNRQPSGQKLTKTTLRIDLKLMSELDEFARSHGLSRSGMIAFLVRRALEHRGAL